jgi:hypothetical protein
MLCCQWPKKTDLNTPRDKQHNDNEKAETAQHSARSTLPFHVQGGDHFPRRCPQLCQPVGNTS